METDNRKIIEIIFLTWDLIEKYKSLGDEEVFSKAIENEYSNLKEMAILVKDFSDFDIEMMSNLDKDDIEDFDEFGFSQDELDECLKSIYDKRNQHLLEGIGSSIISDVVEHPIISSITTWLLWKAAKKFSKRDVSNEPSRFKF